MHETRHDTTHEWVGRVGPSCFKNSTIRSSGDSISLPQFSHAVSVIIIMYMRHEGASRLSAVTRQLLVASKKCLVLRAKTHKISPQMVFPGTRGRDRGLWWAGLGWATGYLSPNVRRISCCPRKL